MGHWRITLGFITYDRVLEGSDDTPFDCGAVATALVSAAWSRRRDRQPGHHAITRGAGARGNSRRSGHHEGIAMGWPDENFPASAVVSERKSVEEATVFVEFEN